MSKSENLARLEVKYPEYLCDQSEGIGERAHVAEQAKTLLGWTEEEPGGVEFKENYVKEIKKSAYPKKVRLENNVTNRPIYPELLQRYMQEILNKRWAGPNGNGTKTHNGEPIIIGEYGRILNGQHTLISLVLAQFQLEHGQYSERWKELWPDGVVKIDKPICYGVSEHHSVVDTMDTCKPRSTADVIYRSPHFKGLNSLDRKKAARILEFAVRFMWFRTGMGGSWLNKERFHAYAPKLSIPEAMSYIEHHPSLVNAVSYVMKQDNSNPGRDPETKIPLSGNFISRFLPLGTAAGLYYLMCVGGSDPEKYRQAPEPAENAPDGSELLNFDNEETANSFFTALTSDQSDAGKRLGGLKAHIFDLKDPTSSEHGSPSEIVGVLCKAWNRFIEDPDNCTIQEGEAGLEYGQPTKDGVRKREEWPKLGGIDLGDPAAPEAKPLPKEKKKKDEATTGVEGNGVTKTRKPRKKKEESGLPSIPTKGGFEEVFAKLREQYKDAVLFFQYAKGEHALFGDDASLIGSMLKRPIRKHPTGASLILNVTDSAEMAKLLDQNGYALATVVEKGDNDFEVTEGFHPPQNAVVETSDEDEPTEEQLELEGEYEEEEEELPEPTTGGGWRGTKEPLDGRNDQN